MHRPASVGMSVLERYSTTALECGPRVVVTGLLPAVSNLPARSGSGGCGCAIAWSRAFWLSIGSPRAPVMVSVAMGWAVVLVSCRSAVNGCGVTLGDGVDGETLRTVIRTLWSVSDCWATAVGARTSDVPS